MINSLILAAGTVAAEEGAHERMLFGIPTFWFGILFAVGFLAMLLVTISFSGRGIVRSHTATDRLDRDEQVAIRSYQDKHHV
ncbi:hypothetical protein [Rothia terrae]|uniref:hypothetical protein n=1 Tax=Rothia terrae TaxID=396015 RepID=UPI0028826FD8|nr:hypothetical protein [Rothia terrae]MDT0188897.1 hypothetical protein [Rothia terrae]